MLFRIKKPCDNCPFRRDVPPFLRAQRVRDLAHTFRSDDRAWFACHKTTSEGTNKRVRRAAQSHCMGATAVLWHERMPNIAMRLALALNVITIEQIEAAQPDCFADLDEFISHHARSQDVEL